MRAGSVLRPGVLVIAAVAVAAVSGCGNPGHRAAPVPARSGSAYHMASPPAYTATDLQFVNRALVYMNNALTLAGEPGVRSDPQVAQLAAGLRTSQEGNLQQLSGWLRRWGRKPPKAPASPTQGTWPDLASSTQIHQLAQLSPTAFRSQFLKLVVADQQGVLAAATLEQESGAFGPARQLAAQLVASSTLTIASMRQMLGRK